MVLCLCFQSDVPRVGRSGNMSRMAKLCILTRTTRLKIMAALFLLSSLLNSSESLADVTRRKDDWWQDATDSGQMIIPYLSSSSDAPGIDFARRYFTQRDTNSRLSRSKIGSAKLALPPSSALSLIQSSPDILQRRSLATISPSPGPGPTSPTPAPPPQETGFVCGICGDSYTAGIGETVSSVAAYCNVTLEGLLLENPGLGNSSNITSTEVAIPCTGNTAKGNCTRCGHSAIIKGGDTVDQLAKGCGLTLAMVEIANPGIDYSSIFPDQYITLPCVNGTIVENVTGCGVCGRGFTAERAELITDIAKRCSNMSVSQLVEANPAFDSVTRTIPGQFVRVPCSGDDPANCGPCGNNITALKGDTLMVIAAKCRVGFIALTNSNPGIDLTKEEGNRQVTIPCDSIPRPVVCSPCSPSFFSNDSVEISTVARTCNVSTAVIAYANNLPLSGAVPAGTNLSIPCANLPRRNLRKCGNCGSSFTLASQVTLEAIAGACGSTVAAIRAENGNFTFELLGPKDEIFLPCDKPQVDCGPCGIGYTTTASDTLGEVAVKCATPAALIVGANPQFDFNQPLRIEQTLHIPCASGFKLSSSGLQFRALECSKQVLHVLIMLTALNIRFIWYLL